MTVMGLGVVGCWSGRWGKASFGLRKKRQIRYNSFEYSNGCSHGFSRIDNILSPKLFTTFYSDPSFSGRREVLRGR